jgi:hypothetical protein
LHVLFVQFPVHQTPEYLGSALSQLRRTLLDPGRGRDTTALSPAPLPPWLEQVVTLGPYERSQLYRLLDESGGGVVTIRGGSGSGKSSTFQHIERVCTAAAEQLTWVNPYGLRRFFFIVDLQTTCGRIHTLRQARSEDDGAVLTDAVELVLRDIAGILDTIFTQHFTDAAFRLLVSDAATFKPAREHYTSLETAQAHLRRKLTAENTSDFTVNDFIRVFDSLDESEQVEVRLLILTQLARALAEEKRALLVVIDNIDPLPVLVQNKLVNVLETSVSSQMWQPLRVAVLTRISTAIHHLGVLKSDMFDHESVDPADMVLYRLTWFFLAMNSFSTFSAQSPEVQQAVISRLFELWRHLIDGRGTLRRLLSAMAGTNIRNAFAFATSWCMSRRFTPEIYSDQILNEFKDNVQQLFGVHLITEIDGSLARIVDAQFTPDEVKELRYAIDVEPSLTAVDAKGTRLAESMLSLLGDMYLLGDNGRVAEDEIRHKACVIGRELLAETLLKPEGALRVTWSLHLALSTALKRVQALPPRDGVMIDRGVVAAFEARLQREVADVAEEERPRVVQLVRWIAGVASTALESPIDETSVARRMVLRDNIDIRMRDRTGRAVFEPLTSRFHAASMLIDPGADDPTIEPNALNVFALGRTRVCPAILRLLYLLAARGSASVRELYSDLHLHGFDPDEEIYVALRQMAHINARLIFAGLSDSNDDLDPWLKSDRKVYLSSAGRGYFEVVVASPAYLQWAFDQIAEVQSAVLDAGITDLAGFVDRIESALIGFEVVVSRELAILRDTWKTPLARPSGLASIYRSLSAEEVSCQSVTADVFFRSYPAFIYALLSHYKSLTRERTRPGGHGHITRVRDLTSRWRNSGRQWLQQHSEIFGRQYEPWQERLDTAESDVEEIMGR